MRTSIKAALVAMLLAVPVALAGGIKVWSTNDTLTAVDLNGNFAHIHNTMVGGHGARLVNADVSAAAAISHTKLATPPLVPKMWGVVTATCAATPCVVTGSSGLTSITRASTGSYAVNFPARTDNVYAVLITPNNNDVHCRYGAPSTTAVGIECRTIGSAPAQVDTGFSVLVMDNDN